MYIYSQGMQLQEPHISYRLGISPKLIHLTLRLWQKNPGFRKNSLCSLIWPDFDSFESANCPLKSSTNFRIWWKIWFCLWSAQVACSKAAQECSFWCKFELVSPKRPVWHTRTRANCRKQYNLFHHINLFLSPYCRITMRGSTRVWVWAPGDEHELQREQTGNERS